MPARPSCPPKPAGVESPESGPGLPFTDSEREGLLERLGQIEDPRKPKGRRHLLAGILAGILVGLLCGAKTLVEIEETLQDLGPEQRARLGLTHHRAPSRVTMGRILTLMDPKVLAQVLCDWGVDATTALTHAKILTQRFLRTKVRHLAVDGKTVRGAKPGGAGGTRGSTKKRHKKTTKTLQRNKNQAKQGAKTHTANPTTVQDSQNTQVEDVDAPDRAPHILAVMDIMAKVVLAQIGVGIKTNEIGDFQPLMNMVPDITGALISIDALGAQDKHATYLHGRGAGLLARVKANRPSLLTAIKALPFGDVTPVLDQIEPGRHGRTTRRVVRVIAETTHLPFPHAAQAVQIITYTRDTDARGHARWYLREIAYAICTLDDTLVSSLELAQIIRAHWGIEVQHWLRDVVMREDQCHVRTGHAPVNLAALRTTVLNILALAGITKIAKTIRRNSRRPTRAFTLLTSTNVL